VRGVGAYGLYDEASHGAKPLVVFDRPVYFAFDVFFILRSDAPSVRYRVDTDEAEARPFLLWPDRDDSPAPRHAARRMFRSLTKALRKG
jgi:hypothetical protein